MYRYETHLHTSPVSKCAKATARETVEFYKDAGYAGIFVTNHFIDGNIDIDRSLPYEERIRFYFSDYEEAKRVGDEIGFSVFCGVEMSYGGTDFLVYGLDMEWFLAHPEIEQMKKSEELAFLKEEGALIIQAHPFREAAYIDHIRLYPRHVEGVEIDNSSRNAFENEMARMYAEHYDLIPFAGSDNHSAGRKTKFAGMESETPIVDEADFIQRIRNRQMNLFHWEVTE